MKSTLSSTAARFGPSFCCLMLIALAGGCQHADAKAKGGKKMTIQITSSAFTQGQPIPKEAYGRRRRCFAAACVGRICQPASRNWR